MITDRDPLHALGLSRLFQTAVARLRADGQTFEQIGRTFGVTKTTVINFASGKQTVVGPKLEAAMARYWGSTGSFAWLKLNALICLSGSPDVDQDELNQAKQRAKEEWDTDGVRHAEAFRQSAREGAPYTEAFVDALAAARGRWTPETIDLARATVAPEGLTSEQWTAYMDRLQALILRERQALLFGQRHSASDTEGTRHVARRSPGGKRPA